MRKLRAEKEITKNWKSDPSKPAVSISCCTFNHERFIEDALEGFLIQDTDFPFDILIHDDASTDRTAAIIREYQQQYPNLIKPIYQTENQFSQGKKVARLNRNRAEGRYIAFCEGDDYWISAEKLQRQFDVLNQNQDIGMVHTEILYVNNEKLTITPPEAYVDLKNRDRDGDIFWDLLMNGNTILTASVMVRKELIDCCSAEWFHYDYWMFSDLARRSKVAFISDKMAAYRMHQGGLMMSNPSFVKTRYEWVRLDMLHKYLFDNKSAWKISNTAFDYAESTLLVSKLIYAFFIKIKKIPKSLVEIILKKPFLILGFFYTVPILALKKLANCFGDKI